MRRRRLWFDLHDESQPAPAVAILGLPYDGAVSLKAGAAGAPARLREISLTSDAVTRRGRVIAGLGVRDFGDVPTAGSDGGPSSQSQFLADAAARLAQLPEDCFAIALGGDNSVSIPCLRRFAARYGRDAGIIWFDAHPDLFEAYDGNPDSHACALRRALALTGLSPGHAVLVGPRSSSFEEVRFIEEQGMELVTAADVYDSKDAAFARIAARLKGVSAVYLAIDIDGFDASCAPGTGYPLPGGIDGSRFFDLHERLFEQLPIRAMDLTEIAPALDVNDMTSFLGAQIVLETLGALALRRA